MSFDSDPSSPGIAIPLCAPVLGGNAWKYVKDCLDTGWVSSVGAYVERFEQMTAERCGAAHAVATVNGTAALHTALLVAGVQPDDDVLVSSLTFIATANAVRYVGARAVPIDAEPCYWQLDPTRVEEFLRTECRRQGEQCVNRRTGRRISTIVAADILGHPVDMDALAAIARSHGLVLVEDAAESLGAGYRGRPAGNLAQIGCLSFNGNKLVTAGGGGMIITDNAAWAERARYLTTQAKDDPIEYVHGDVGYNYRLSNLQAALGCAQMEQLDERLVAKRRIALSYARELADVPGLKLMSEASWAASAWWLFTVLVDEAEFGMSSRQLLAHLQTQGIQSRPLWQPMHRSAVHQAADNPECPVADRLYEQALSLPSSVDLSDEQLQRVVGCIRAAQASYAGRRLRT